MNESQENSVYKSLDKLTLMIDLLSQPGCTIVRDTPPGFNCYVGCLNNKNIHYSPTDPLPTYE